MLRVVARRACSVLAAAPKTGSRSVTKQSTVLSLPTRCLSTSERLRGNITIYASGHVQPGDVKDRFKHSVLDQEALDEEFDAQLVRQLNDPEINGHDLRMLLNEIINRDFIPEPEIVTAALYACRRINEHCVAVRFLESLYRKCGPWKDVYAWLEQEIKPTMDELGISSMWEMEYDEPELWCEDMELNN